jgi:Spy/CpxP family protein refolding chaperone
MKKLMTVLFGCMLAMQVYGFVYAMEGGECCKGGSCMKDNGQSMEKMHEKHLNKMTKDLNLTPEQKDKISAIMKEKGEKRKAEMEKMHENSKTEMEATDKSIKEVLTPEQAQKYDKMKAERAEKMEKKMKKGHHQEEK